MCRFSLSGDWEAVSAVATLLAVVAAFGIALMDRRNRVHDQVQAERAERTRGLIGLHQLCLICSKRIREYWDDLSTKSAVPSFRLPTISYDEALRIVPQLLVNSADVELAIRTVSEHHHINDKFDDVELAFGLFQNYRVQKTANRGSASVSGTSSIEDFGGELKNRVMSAASSLNAAIPVVYRMNLQLMRLIEEQVIGGRVLRDMASITEGSFTEPEHLKPQEVEP